MVRSFWEGQINRRPESLGELMPTKRFGPDDKERLDKARFFWEEQVKLGDRVSMATLGFSGIDPRGLTDAQWAERLNMVNDYIRNFFNARPIEAVGALKSEASDGAAALPPPPVT